MYSIYLDMLLDGKVEGYKSFSDFVLYGTIPMIITGLLMGIGG